MAALLFGLCGRAYTQRRPNRKLRFGPLTCASYASAALATTNLPEEQAAPRPAGFRQLQFQRRFAAKPSETPIETDPITTLPLSMRRPVTGDLAAGNPYCGNKELYARQHFCLRSGDTGGGPLSRGNSGGGVRDFGPSGVTITVT
jgi:hypothetical protein